MSKQEFTYKKERRFKVSVDFFTLLKILGYFLLFLGIWYILYKKYIYFYLVKDTSQLETYIMSILVSITLMLFLIACGIITSFKNPKVRIMLIVLVLYIVYLDFTNVGLGIEFRRNFGLLFYEIYESNSYKGINFFVLNFLTFWLYIYVITLFLESEE